MAQKVETADRIVRIILGLGIIGWGIYAQSRRGAIGIVPLLTALIGWCPAYPPFGISTGPTKAESPL